MTLEKNDLETLFELLEEGVSNRELAATKHVLDYLKFALDNTEDRTEDMIFYIKNHIIDRGELASVFFYIKEIKSELKPNMDLYIKDTVSKLFKKQLQIAFPDDIKSVQSNNTNLKQQ